MNIEAGKSYRTRDGRKATVYRVDAKSYMPIHGCVLFVQEERVQAWHNNGTFWQNAESEFDLIAPWTDTPTMDVTALPRWATHVECKAIGLAGQCMWYWSVHNHAGTIPDDFCPKQSAPRGSRYRIDWDNKCLVEEGGGK